MARQQRRLPPRGSLERPYSALNLRLVLAGFGLVVCGAFAALAAIWRAVPLTVLFAVLAAIAAVDIGVVARRRAQRRRQEGDGHHTLFE